MKNQFVSYEQSLALKELGFDEPCWSYFITPFGVGEGIFNDSMFLKDYEYLDTMPKHSTYILAPLKSQVFRWFRREYNLWGCIQNYPTSENPNRCYYELKGDNINTDKDESPNSYMSGWFDSYEEAESGCIDKLIEIVKNK